MAQHACILPLQVIFLVFTVLTASLFGAACGTRAVVEEISIPLHTYILVGMVIEDWLNAAYYCHVVVVFTGYLITVISWWETVTEWANGVLAREEQAREEQARKEQA